MCMGGGSPPPPAPPPAPPPPAEDAPMSPAFNEASARTQNDGNRMKANRLGRNSLRINLNAGDTRSGMNIPQ